MTPPTDADVHATWGGPATLSAWDTVMWRAEGDPRTTSTGMLVGLLESAPEWEDFVAVLQDVAARVPRLRERVVEPRVPLVRPRWSPDPSFDLAHHVRRIDLGGSATQDDLLTYCENESSQRLQRHRPPWVAVLVHGLADGQAAYVLKCHHSLTDGMGLVQLMDLIHDETPTRSAGSTPHARPRQTMTRNEVLARGIGDVAEQFPRALASTARGVRRALSAPRAHADHAAQYATSLNRLLGSMPRRSPLLRGGGVPNRLLMIDVELEALRRAGRSVGGSVNDAYVAAILGGLRLYHEKFDIDIDTIPIAMPISLRSPDDPAGGNRFAGVRFAAPLAERDPAIRMQHIGAFVRSVRTEPAISYLDGVSAALSRLPKPALIEVTARATAAADVQISNIPGLRRPAYLAGARVLGTYPFGPRPGVPAMVTMMTLEGHGCIGLNVDARVFRDIEILHECLVGGIREVLATAENAEEQQ